MTNDGEGNFKFQEFRSNLSFPFLKSGDIFASSLDYVFNNISRYIYRITLQVAYVCFEYVQVGPYYFHKQNTLELPDNYE